MYQISQLHIDIARNATDDFNLFHDRYRWQWVKDNPFNGPIALGFQLGLFIESQIKSVPDHKNIFLPFTTYEFNFANPVRVDDVIHVELKKSRESETEQGKMISQRVCLKVNGKPAIIGFKRDSEYSPLPNNFESYTPEKLSEYKDRTFIQDNVFLKRKWMIVGNAKNFLLSTHADQTIFIDEFADKVDFPQMYPLSLISSALLERAQAINHDLIANPQIYVSHHLCIDNIQLAKLRSNDCLQMLVKQVSGDNTEQSCLQVCGWVNQEQPLFIAELKLASLQMILKPQA
ncbi:hypothetical protein [Glaciecola sp. 1036]|uniref:hypothetical protein n=1 Tax=Alteromonadaceae TaxID=72275 RepID=UPI003D09260E